MFETILLHELPQKNCGILREPSGTRPALWVIEEGGKRVVVKDYSVNGFFFRNTVGRFLVWRETRAYGRLRGMRGIPGFHCVIGGLALIIDEMPGKNMEGLEMKEKLPPRFFLELRDLVDNVHERGLTHCDLKRAPNIIVGCDGKPIIIDWSAALMKHEFGFFPLNLIYQRFLQDDYDAVIKVQLRHCPESVKTEELERYHQRSAFEKMIRSIRDNLRELLQKVT
jgi:RIO-like serine/threonine protein kinase